MNYYKYTFAVNEEKREILLALIGEFAFDTFEETTETISAYVPEKSDTEIDPKALEKLKQFVDFDYEKTFIPYQNWNDVWESNFQPILVDNFCGIRADFHPNFDKVDYELLINPQMAFGTGHHETTFMMIQAMQPLDFSRKKVLDYGCGTGILAILAGMLGADPIDAVDIEEPSFINTKENALLNGINNVHSILGTLDNITDHDYDIILANINRHVILDSLPTLYQKLNPDGTILFSGILETDFDLIKKALNEEKFILKEKNLKGNWLCLVVTK